MIKKIPRQFLLDPEIYEMEQESKARINHAITVLSPFFNFQNENCKLPDVEVTHEVVNMSYNPLLNRVNISSCDFPLQNILIGEEAGHYLHFKTNPLFGKYPNKKGKALRQLIECVGRYSGIVYAKMQGEKINPIKGELDEIHKVGCDIAEYLFGKYKSNFLYQLSQMKYPEFMHLKNNLYRGKIK